MARPRRKGTPPSIKDVASLAGVSVGTVSNALNYPDKVSPDLVARVNSAIEMLGYVRNEAARQLRVGHSDTIGLIVPHFENAFYSELSRGVDDAATALGLSVLTGGTYGSEARHSQLVSLFEKYRVAGIIIAPHSLSALPHAQAQQGTPLVLVGYKGKALGIPSVGADDRGAGALAVRHLLEQGATKIAIVTADFPTGEAYVARQNGALAALRRDGAASAEVITVSELSVEAGRQVGQELLKRSPDERPDGVFASHDLWAIGLLHALQDDDRGVMNIAVVGCEDIDTHRLSPIPLTSVHLPAYDIGQKALDLLVASGGSGPSPSDHEVISATLIPRASSTRHLLDQHH